MTLMTLYWTIAAIAVAGLALGAGLGWYVASRRRQNQPAAEIHLLDAATDRQIAAAAARWAEASGRPEATALLASKLRIAWALMEREKRAGPPHGGRWTR